MENLKNKKIYKHPFLFSILVFLMYNGFTIVFSTIVGILVTLISFFNHGRYENLISTFKLTSPFVMAINVISILLSNLIFKNLRIYTKGNFFKTVKVSSVYLVYVLAILICVTYTKIQTNPQFKSTTEIILSILTLIFTVGFVEESLFRGLILNIFAKKYLYEPKGILKILVFPSVIFGFVHLFNIFVGVSLEKVILQSVMAFFTGILLNAIYIRSGNIFVLILIHAIIDASGLFEHLFLKTNITLSNSINKISYITLVYIPLYLLLTIFLLRKSKLEEVKENLKEINQI